MNLEQISKTVGKLLIKHRLTVGICESCTGGMLGGIITQVPGSSKYFRGGVIAYSNEVKTRIIGVKISTLRKCGAVSAEVAQEMADGVRKKLKSDIGIGITGIAGPSGGTKKKPVGLIYVSLSYRRIILVKVFLYKGPRDQIRKKACKAALLLLLKLLK
jgi:nicotinamide-nucleotide amidase